MNILAFIQTAMERTDLPERYKAHLEYEAELDSHMVETFMDIVSNMGPWTTEQEVAAVMGVLPPIMEKWVKLATVEIVIGG